MNKKCIYIFFLAVLTATPSLFAASIIVNSYDTESGCSLAEAISSANNVGLDLGNGCETGEESNSISFALTQPNTIVLTSSLPTITNELSIDGFTGAETVVVDGAGTHRLFHIANANVNFSNITLINGFSETAGGGIHIEDSSVVSFENVRFSGNVAPEGGAIFLDSGSELALLKCSFESNEATSSDVDVGGGAIFARYSNLNVSQSSFVDNVAHAGQGGALLIVGVEQIQGLEQVINTTTLNIDASAFHNNRAGSFGGAVASYVIKEASVTNTLVHKNVAGGDGGGLYVLFNELAHLQHLTLTENESMGRGGGLFYWATFFHPTNRVRLYNSILSGNVSSQSSDEIFLNPFHDEYHTTDFAGNIIGSNQVSTLKGLNQHANNALGINTNVYMFADRIPSLSLQQIVAPLGGNGGSTNTRALVEGSPAIRFSKRANTSKHCLEFDQRMAPRISNAETQGCDAGSFNLTSHEHGNFSTTYTIPTTNGTAVVVDL